MFPFITKTWNPVGGECGIGCYYCWARQLIKKYGMKKYQGEPRLFISELQKTFTKDDFVFVCDMRDLFEPNVPSAMIQQVLNYIAKSSATFLLLTKNPHRYLEFAIPQNCVCGATIETDIDGRIGRFISMRELKHPRKMIAIEPIMEFTPEFQDWIFSICPEFIAVGYDNYGNHLSEPELEDVLALIHGCENRGVRVYRKTLREKKQT